MSKPRRFGIALMATAAATVVMVFSHSPPVQAASRQCLSKWGRTVCGYDCKAKYGRVKCAKTPKGRCTIAHGVVKCWDPAGDDAAPGHKRIKRPVDRAQCIKAYGSTVCGYGCVKAFGKAKCSQYPGGKCWKNRGRIACTDDTRPGWTRPIHPGPGGPKPQCVSKYGRTVCGFGCVAKYGQVKCAKTEAGVCKAASGRIHCWDPPHPYRGMPKAQCKTRYGHIACGYDCVGAYGQVKCAQTPRGVCKAAYGKITCWDPPRPTKGKEKSQ